MHPALKNSPSEYPHVPAAFINAIAEEGTKEEAVEWLQKLWNENCALRAALQPAPGKMPTTVAELEAILNSEDDSPITINPDGSIAPR